jgi:hypothetical protein
MFAILWEDRQNPRIWSKSSHLGIYDVGRAYNMLAYKPEWGVP